MENTSVDSLITKEYLKKRGYRDWLYMVILTDLLVIMNCQYDSMMGLHQMGHGIIKPEQIEDSRFYWEKRLWNSLQFKLP